VKTNEADLLHAQVARAQDRVSELLGPREGSAWEPLLRRLSQLRNGGRKLRGLAGAADAPSLADLLTEVEYALVFVGLGFTVEIEPRGAIGPDLRVKRDGASMIVEVKRLRPIAPETRIFDPKGEPLVTLPIYGDWEVDVRKGLEAIVGKFRQLRDEPGVLALRTDDAHVEEINLEQAVRDIRGEWAEGIRAVPAKLGHVIIGGPIQISDRREYICVPLTWSGPAPAWCSDLEATTSTAAIRAALRGAVVV
jgi:hypothetical protein